MKTQCFSNWRQKKANKTFRTYQLNRDKTLSKPKRLTKKYLISKLKK